MFKIGFDNEKYLQMQSDKIRERIGAGGDMPFNQPPEGGEVDAVGRHWRHERNAGAAE